MRHPLRFVASPEDILHQYPQGRRLRSCRFRSAWLGLQLRVRRRLLWLRPQGVAGLRGCLRVFGAACLGVVVVPLGFLPSRPPSFHALPFYPLRWDQQLLLLPPLVLLSGHPALSFLAVVLFHLAFLLHPVLLSLVALAHHLLSRARFLLLLLLHLLRSSPSHLVQHMFLPLRFLPVVHLLLVCPLELLLPVRRTAAGRRWVPRPLVLSSVSLPRSSSHHFHPLLLLRRVQLLSLRSSSCPPS
mmetsp:Transcript_8953/g.55060  ORF Transcript_8953/g.55060 Transcript_8953/m.55060 type:complete len:243 (+) Transcript_8953:2730-3458(+)